MGGKGGEKLWILTVDVLGCQGLPPGPPGLKQLSLLVNFALHSYIYIYIL